MAAECENWIDYWNHDAFWRDSPLWEINSRIFFEKAKQVLDFRGSDCVLNIGCGSGYTEFFLAPLVQRVHAVDVADQFLDMCSERCKDYQNVTVGPLKKEDYTNLEHLQGPFSVILCVSVVQYYKNVEEVEALISSARKVAAPGAKMLIADLPLKRNSFGFLWDALCSLVLSFKGGYSLVLLKVAFKRWAQKTSYRDFYSKTKQLYFSRRQLETLIERMGLQAEILQEDFSVYANRLRLLIQF